MVDVVAEEVLETVFEAFDEATEAVSCWLLFALLSVPKLNGLTTVWDELVLLLLSSYFSFWAEDPEREAADLTDCAD